MKDFQVIKKSSFYFIGLKWTGTYEAAAHGEIRPVIEASKVRLKELNLAGENSSLIGLSYQDRPDGFTYYIGTEAMNTDGIPPDLHGIIVPSNHYAVTEHEGQNAWKSYEKLYRWVEKQGLQINSHGLIHLEVYSMDYDPYKMSPSLVIGVPLKKKGKSID
ncbi:GyrI-like domain-containing protein [Jeotgalibacillus proteolyticus]|uniref:AraC effector-binding domain-containing protein n=1 Tax=Jeotgalibacillus proteolyticus TaxID=2082395 RepID=A0A2S5G7H6_9BACL|nr:GyrI-like domain-containing protein [Jeotgalibacillus proteolyticus]PPA68881.1 hypothetical protein C4B60_18365 [Jeotgalibacillus proteolyticus]